MVVIAVIASATLLSHTSVSTNGSDNTAQPTWSSGQQLDANNGLAISCPVADFCVAVGTDGYEFTYSGNAWSDGQKIDTNDRSVFGSVSCPSTTFCVAVDGNGSEFTYSGGTWSDGQKIDTNTGSAGPLGLISVSCPAITFCVAMDYGGNEFTYSDGTWSSGQKIDANTDSIGGKSLGIIGIHVSCPTVDFCVAVDADGYEFTYSGGTWSSGKQISSGLITVSCVTANFCIAAGGSYEFTYSSGTWSNGDEVGTRMNANGLIGLESVSCATTSFCVVVGGEGRELTYSGGAWSSSKQIDNNLSDKGTHFPLLYVSCPTLSFCAATDANGFVFIAKGSGQKTASTTTVPPTKTPTPTATTPVGFPCSEPWPPAPSGLVSALTPLLTQGVNTMNEIAITICVDPNNQSWALYSIGSAPGFSVQGAGGIAQEVGGVWMVVSGPGTAGIGCVTEAPADVQAAFGMTCPSATASPTTPSQPTTSTNVPIPTTTTEPPTTTRQACPTGTVTSTISFTDPLQSDGQYVLTATGTLTNGSTSAIGLVTIFWTATYADGSTPPPNTDEQISSGTIAPGASVTWSDTPVNQKYGMVATSVSVSQISYSDYPAVPGCYG